MENKPKFVEIPIDQHNKLVKNIDEVIQELNVIDPTDLELKNAISGLLEASKRINAYYIKVNQAKTNETKED